MSQEFTSQIVLRPKQALRANPHISHRNVSFAFWEASRRAWGDQITPKDQYLLPYVTAAVFKPTYF